MRADRLQAALAAYGSESSPRDLAEVLWLAAHVGPAVVAALGPEPSFEPVTPPPGGPSPDLDSSLRAGTPASIAPRGPAVPLHLPAGHDDAGVGATGLLAPAAPALGQRLALQRALRPLGRRVPDPQRYVVDEAATADRIADQDSNERRWLPVVRPATRRWLDLALILDSGPSMAMWRQLMAELRQTLAESGIFRNIIVWDLHGIDSGPPTLVPEGGLSHRSPAALVRPDGRQITLVVSDCSGPAWHGGAAAGMLHQLGGHGPVGIVQPLPEQLWDRTAMPATVGRLVAPGPCAPNVQARFSAYDGMRGPGPGDLVVPVLELRPAWLAGWAKLVATGAPLDPAAVAYVQRRATPVPVRPDPAGGTPQELVRAFLATASPGAARLMRCMATTTPAVPLMQLIQQAVLGHSVPADVAEVVLSGLLTPTRGVPGRYAFLPGVREVLLGGLSRADATTTVDLLIRVSDRIEREAGLATRVFRALVPDSNGADQRVHAADAFALISEEALWRLYPAGERRNEQDRRIRLGARDPGLHLRATLVGHTGPVWALTSLSLPDGRTLLAAAGDDTTIRMWEASTGESIGAMLVGHTGCVYALTVLQLGEGPFIASGGADGVIRLWNPMTGSSVGPPLTGHTGTVSTLTTRRGPDGALTLFSGGEDGTIRSWVPANRYRLIGTAQDSDAVLSLAVMDLDGAQLLISGSRAGAISLHDVTLIDGMRQLLVDNHDGQVNAVAVLSTEDGPLILSAGDDGTVRISDPRTNIQRRLSGHRGFVNAVCPLPGGGFASAGVDTMIRIWAADGTPTYVQPSGHAGPISALALVVPPDGSTVLATASLDRTIRLWDMERVSHAQLLRKAVPPPSTRPRISPADDDGVSDRAPSAKLTAQRLAYLKQVRRIAPTRLNERTDELAMLAEFCADINGSPYLYLSAPAWAGKSALLSWFVLHPPSGVQIVSFFITSYFAGQSDRIAFVDALLEQLAELLGQATPNFLTEATGEEYLLGMLAEAATACQQQGERLVLVVDGLDEDPGLTIGPGARSIAALLPLDPPAGMKIIVSGRPNPPIPSDVANQHPLLGASTTRTLTVSPHSHAIRANGERDVNRLLTGGPIERDLLGLLSAAGGPLAVQDLVELIGASEKQIKGYLNSLGGRVFAQRSTRSQQNIDAYMVAHEELRQVAVGLLGPARMQAYLDRLHAWADSYRVQGWPSYTPGYLLDSYFGLLQTTNDVGRMVALATDQKRQECMVRFADGDIAAVFEIAFTITAFFEGGEPIARAVERLSESVNLAATIARRIASPDKGGRALTTLVRAIAAAGMIDHAEGLFRAISDPDQRSQLRAEFVHELANKAHDDKAFATVLTWLHEAGNTPEAQYVLRALLQRELSTHQTDIAVAQANAWLDQYGRTPAAKYVLGALANVQLMPAKKAVSLTRTSLVRAPVRERLRELLLTEPYQSVWHTYLLRSSGEISYDAIARVVAAHENSDWYRRYSQRVSDALSPRGEGPTWTTLEKIMRAFNMTQAEMTQLRTLMRRADGLNQVSQTQGDEHES